MSKDKKAIDSLIDDLQKDLGAHKLTPYQVKKIRKSIANYTFAAALDSKILEEAEIIVEE